MKWHAEYSTRADKCMKKIRDPKIRKRILDKVDELISIPRKGKFLRGKYRKYGIRSVRFGTPGGEYRILYKLFPKDKEIYVIFFGTREEIYDLLSRLDLKIFFRS